MPFVLTLFFKFIIQDKDGNIVPIEVKSNDFTQYKCLTLFISEFIPKYSIRISSKNFVFSNKIKSIQLYAVFRLKK